jgi:hypothetical protein
VHGESRRGQRAQENGSSKTFENRNLSARWTFFEPKNLQCVLPGSDFQVTQRSYNGDSVRSPISLARLYAIINHTNISSGKKWIGVSLFP